MSQQDKKQQQKHVVVIGAGVIGLSSALLLLVEAGHAVTIVAEHFPAPFETIHPLEQIDYASPWAGAHNRFIPPLPSSSSSPDSPSQSQSQARREHALSIRTYHRMKALSSSSSDDGTEAESARFSSVRFMKGVEFLENPSEEYLALTEDRASSAELGIEEFRLLTPQEFPDDGRVKWGCEYRTWCLNPMVYCCFLLRRFVRGGGKILRRRLRSPREAFQLSLPSASLGGEESQEVEVVVNASGTGFGEDPDVFVTRGQTCVVAESGTTTQKNGQEEEEEEEPVTVTRQNADGSWTFCIPRGADGGTVVGGTKEPDNYDTKPCPVVREQLLQRIVRTHPGLLALGRSRLTPLRDIVGRRPTRRGGPRIEGEVVALTGKEEGGKKDGFVMHAYGMGGRGYELSWGVAEEVVKGVSQYFVDVEQKSGL